MPANLLNQRSHGPLTVGCFAAAGSKTCEVGSGWAMIGGGARVHGDGLLTACYPEDATTWRADFGAAGTGIDCYALGLRIDGVSASELRDLVQINRSAWSPRAAHPSRQTYAPSGQVLLSGGFLVEPITVGSSTTWFNYAHRSIPAYHRYEAASKDHIDSAPSRIRTWTLSLPEEVGPWQLAIKRWQKKTAKAAHPKGGAAVEHGFLVCGGGAAVHWKGAGSMLTSLVPDVALGAFHASAKDHIASDPSKMTVYVKGIQAGPRE